MKKLMTLCMVGSAMALSACASNGSDVDYSYEQQAPYAEERTASGGPEDVVVVETKKVEHKMERTFEKAQRK